MRYFIKINVVPNFTTRIVIFLILFISPYLGLLIHHFTNLSICEIYTFGLSLKDFSAIYVSIFGVIGIAINILFHQKRLVNQQDQLNIQSMSERNSRFTKSVELLANHQESVRIGAVYSLFNIAKENRETFSSLVLDILCSHIRNLTNTTEYLEKYSKEPSIEINTIFKLVFNKDSFSSIFGNKAADLTNSKLKGIQIENVCLNDANINNVDFEKAYFFKSEFIKANFEQGNFVGAEFRDCNLRSSIIKNCNFIDTTFNKVHFEDSFINNVNFENSYLYSPHFEGSNFFRAHFSLTEINDGFFYGIHIASSGSFFYFTELKNCHFDGSILTHISFYGSTFDTVSLDCCFLDEINFKGCDITKSSIHGGGSFDLETKEKNDFSKERKFLLNKQIQKESHISRRIKFGQLTEKEKEIIKKTLGENNFSSTNNEDIDSNLYMGSDIISKKNDFQIGIPDSKKISKIKDRLSKIEKEIDGWRAKRNIHKEDIVYICI